MKAEDLPKLSLGEGYYTTDLENRLIVEEALLDTGEELDKKIHYISKLKQYSYVAKDDYNLWLAKHFQVSYIPINDEVKVYLKRTETPFVTEAPPKEAPVDKEIPTTEVPKKKKYSMFG